LALNRIVVLRYRSRLESRQLAPGTVNLRFGAVRRLAQQAADCGLLSADLAAGIRRLKGVKKCIVLLVAVGIADLPRIANYRWLLFPIVFVVVLSIFLRQTRKDGGSPA
jgi:hypothetical protein